MALLGIHGRGLIGALGIGGIFLFEIWYAFQFFRYITRSREHRRMGFCILALAFVVYALFFVPINNLELWLDEIEVIRFGQLPLGAIAREVMTKHVVVPPLDYWHMWVWDKVAARVPVYSMEFAYRVPYMLMHTTTATLLGMTLLLILRRGSRVISAGVLVTGFLLYFLSPLPFIYSYEVRYYGFMLLGAALVIALYYRKKLFEPRLYPLLLLFCLNSVFHFIILLPFLVKGMVETSTRHQAKVLIGALFLMAVIVIPFLYVPRLAISAGDAIPQSVLLLTTTYLDVWWKWVIVSASAILLILFRRKNAMFFMLTCLVYVLLVIGLESIIQYPYFGARHFIFLLPFGTVILYELATIHSSWRFKLMWVGLIWVTFLLPFFAYIGNMYAGLWLMPKLPTGLKHVFAYATSHAIERVLVEYGNTNKDDVEYYNMGISWYADHYPQVTTRQYTAFAGCKTFSESHSALLYIVPDAGSCESLPPRTTITRLYEATMVTKDN